MGHVNQSLRCTKHKASARALYAFWVSAFAQYREVIVRFGILVDMKNLPTVTLVIIDCVDVKRAQLALDISCQDMSFGAVRLLTSIPTDDPRAVQIAPLNSIDAYSKFCLLDLHRYVETSHVLVIQYDGFVVNPGAWQDAFLDYDYIGAPILIGDWAIGRHGVPAADIGKLVVGNGGFSLRSKRLTELTAALGHSGDFVLTEPEDWAMCYTERAKLEASGMTFAPVPLAEAFSFEGRTAEYCQYRDSFGFHSLRWTDLSPWLATHPEYRSQIRNVIEMEGYYAG